MARRSRLGLIVVCSVLGTAVLIGAGLVLLWAKPHPAPSSQANRRPSVASRPGTASPPGTSETARRNSLSGSVRDVYGRALAGASVSVHRADRSPLGEPVATASARADGAFEIDLEGDSPPSSSIVVVRQPGYRTSSRPPEQDAETSSWRADLVLTPGGMVRGRVLTSERAPAAGASIEVACESMDGPLPPIVTDAAGSYEFPNRMFGPCRLRAILSGVGLGCSESLLASPGEDLLVAPILLRRQGTIAGSVRHSDGSLVAHALVRAELANMAASFQEMSSDGLPSGTVRADGSGGFSISGLRSGDYVLSSWPGMAAAEARWPTGTSSAVLTVDCYRVHVRVRDPEGRSISDAFCSGWSDTCEVHCATELDDHGEAVYVMGKPGRFVAFTQGEPQQIPGALTSAATMPVESAIDIPARQWESWLELVLRSPNERCGSLHLSAKDPQGRSIAHFSGRLQLPLSRASCMWLGSSTGTTRLTVPEGRYRLMAQCAGDGQYWQCVEQEIEVRADEQTSLELRPRAGGRLRLVLRVANVSEAKRLKLELASPGGALETVSLLVPEHGDGVITGLLVHHASSSRRDVISHSDVFEPGTRTLTISCPGFKPVKVQLAIEADQTTECEAWLERE